MNSQNKKPRFSIILPTYNRGEIIKSAIESVINQTFQDWELLIIDNASQDNTTKIVSQYSDDRVKYYKYEELVPLNENWERGLKFVGGDFFIVLGDDDFFCRMLLEEVDAAAGDSDLIVVNSASFTAKDPVGKVKNILFLTDYTNKTYNFNPIDISKNYQTFNLEPLSIAISQLHPSVFFFKAKLVEAIKNKYNGFYKSFYPDWIAHTLYGLYAKKAVFIDKPLVVVGGVDAKYYCYTNSKDSYFGLKLDLKYIGKIKDLEKDLPKIVGFFLKYKSYPYFSGRIVTQLLLNLIYVKEIDEEKYKIALNAMIQKENLVVAKLYENLSENYHFCRKIGDNELSDLEKDIEKNNVKKFRLKIKCKILLNSMFLNRITFFSSIYIYILNKVKKNGSWNIIDSGCISDCEKIIDDA